MKIYFIQITLTPKVNSDTYLNNSFFLNCFDILPFGEKVRRENFFDKVTSISFSFSTIKTYLLFKLCQFPCVILIGKVNMFLVSFDSEVERIFEFVRNASYLRESSLAVNQIAFDSNQTLKFLRG